MNSVLVDPATGVPEPRYHPPADKSVVSATSLGAWSTATIGAGASGIQRVVTSLTVSMCTAPSVLATTTIGIQILDGTTMIWGAVVSVGSAGVSPPIVIPNLNLLTSSATTVSAGFDKAVSLATQFVTLTYHDIGV